MDVLQLNVLALFLLAAAFLQFTDFFPSLPGDFPVHVHTVQTTLLKEVGSLGILVFLVGVTVCNIAEERRRWRERPGQQRRREQSASGGRTRARTRTLSRRRLRPSKLADAPPLVSAEKASEREPEEGQGLDDGGGDEGPGAIAQDANGAGKRRLGLVVKPSASVGGEPKRPTKASSQKAAPEAEGPDRSTQTRLRERRKLREASRLQECRKPMAFVYDFKEAQNKKAKNKKYANALRTQSKPGAAGPTTTQRTHSPMERLRLRGEEGQEYDSSSSERVINKRHERHRHHGHKSDRKSEKEGRDYFGREHVPLPKRTISVSSKKMIMPKVYDTIEDALESGSSYSSSEGGSRIGPKRGAQATEETPTDLGYTRPTAGVTPRVPKPKITTHKRQTRPKPLAEAYPRKNQPVAPPTKSERKEASLPIGIVMGEGSTTDYDAHETDQANVPRSKKAEPAQTKRKKRTKKDRTAGTKPPNTHRAVKKRLRKKHHKKKRG